MISSTILSGQPILYKGRTLVVQSHAIQVKLPLMPSTLVWNRPFAVQVQNEGEVEQSLPIVDYVRIAQVLLLAAGLLGSILVWRKNK